MLNFTDKNFFTQITGRPTKLIFKARGAVTNFWATKVHSFPFFAWKCWDIMIFFYSEHLLLPWLFDLMMKVRANHHEWRIMTVNKNFGHLRISKFWYFRESHHCDASSAGSWVWPPPWLRSWWRQTHVLNYQIKSLNYYQMHLLGSDHDGNKPM